MAKKRQDKEQAEVCRPIPRAECEGELPISTPPLPCAVLEGGIRILSGRGMSTALGRHVTGSGTPRATKHGKPQDDRVAELPSFLGAKNLKPFIDADLTASLNSPLEYIPKEAGRTAYGYRAELLPKICDVWLKARDAGVLRAHQKATAAKADILMRGLAHVGVIALIDEVTGYQQVRDQNDLATILRAFVAKELQPWVRTFPLEYYEQICRLKNWPQSYALNRPGHVGHLTNDLIYSRLAPGVLDELRRKNPVSSASGRRTSKHHQHLTPERGHPILGQHLARVVAYMQTSRNWDQFCLTVEEFCPRLNETPILHGFQWEDDRLQAG